jgi:hypothetical protein
VTTKPLVLDMAVSTVGKELPGLKVVFTFGTARAAPGERL